VGIDAEPPTPELKDVELGSLGKELDRPVAAYPFLTAVLNPGNAFLVVVVKCKFLRFPRLRMWMVWFGPVLFLSLLSSLPLFVAVTIPNKNIQKYDVSDCSIVSFFEVNYYTNTYNLAIQVQYKVNGVTRTGDITHNAADYSFSDDMYIQLFYQNAYDSGEPFPCYYKGDFVTATDIPRYLSQEAAELGWYLTGGLVGGWLFIILLIAVSFLCSVGNDRRTLIYKEIYEGTGNTHVSVEDWGSVGFNMRQALHAFIYAWIVRESGTTDFPDKKVRITNFETLNTSARIFGLVMSSTIAFLFFAGAVPLLTLAFFPTNTSVIEAYWCLGIIVAIVPCLMAVVFLSAKFNINFRATAEISNKADNTMIDLTITNGVYSPIGVANDILSGNFSSSTV
jgi:hypothetical protein